MERKIKMLEEYIAKLDTAIAKNDSAMAQGLQKEIIAVYDSEIDGLKSGLDNYSFSPFGNSQVDYIDDAKMLIAKLQNYKNNLTSGLFKVFQASGNEVNVTQQVDQQTSVVINITLQQVVNAVNELPSSQLSNEEKEVLNGKLASISAEQDKKKRWEKVGSALKWIAEKGIEVGIAALPYIVQSLGAGS